MTGPRSGAFAQRRAELRIALRHDARLRILHDRAVAAQLALEALRDRGRSPTGDRLEDLTILVKTFHRPAALRRFVDSVRRFYPRVAVLVVDDSRVPRPVAGCSLLPLPYDQGVSAGRNAGLARVRTPFFLLADDDYVFYRGTYLEGTLATLRAHAELDVVGGLRVDLPTYRVASLPRPHGAHGPRPDGRVAGLRRREMVSHFLLGRTDTVRALGWDPELKLVEHADFFGRALGTLTVVEDPRLRVLHARTLADRAYMRIREDVETYEEALWRKWQLGRGVSPRRPRGSPARPERPGARRPGSGR